MIRFILPKKSISVLIVAAAMLSACSGGDHEDIKAFMDEVKAKPIGHIAPIPTFRPYEAFTYSATAMRGPFDKPLDIKDIALLAQPSSNVKPDLNRVKEFLERFGIEALSMVGSLDQYGQLWVLIDDGDGGVHRVKNGDFMGRNHGKIVGTTDRYVSVVEIVPNGVDGWVERPHTLQLRD